MAHLFRWLRRSRKQETGVARTADDSRRVRWIILESVASPAMGSIYAQVLEQAGIPVQLQQWGAGAGAMGGAATGVRLLVPENRLEAAREVLDVGTAASEVAYE